MKELQQVTVIGMGLLGGSITLSVLRSFSGVKVVGYSHRASTRRKARQMAVAGEIAEDMLQSVQDADMVILATPVCTFQGLFEQLSGTLPSGCIVTDVGSTKTLVHNWAASRLPGHVHYVGSHPIAGSEQRGVEFARDDLLYNAMCIVTTTEATNRRAAKRVADFWSALGCVVKKMTPDRHDELFANVSHLPHVTAAALINANKEQDLKFAGRGFVDTSRVASGPANIWTDILMTNSRNVADGIDRLILELEKLKKVIKNQDATQITQLLEQACEKRKKVIRRKMQSRELLS